MIHTYKFYYTLGLLSFILSCQKSSPPVEIQEEVTPLSSEIIITQKQFNASEFTLGEVEKKSFSKTINTIGLIHLPEKNKADVSTMIGGTVGAIDFIQGQYIRKGQRLFSLTNPSLISLQEDFLISKNQMVFLENEKQRQLALSEENITTRKELNKIQVDFKSEQARFEALKQKLILYGLNPENLTAETMKSSIYIKAPISGNISEINIHQGAYLEAGTAAVQIANKSHLHLELEVLEKEIGFLRKGLALNFTVQGKPDKIFTAEIYLINASINDRHTIAVHCHLPANAQKELLPGMFANATIALNKYETEALPTDAVISADGKSQVLWFTGESDNEMTFEKMEVKTGLTQNGYVEILDGSTIKGKRILTKGAYFLL